MLFVSGLDITIVGHFDYANTAYYSIATSPTTFVLVFLSAILGPIMPASSALSVQRSADKMGELLIKTTRYSTIILLLTGLPLLVFGYRFLYVWVGAAYALPSLLFLQILISSNIVRNISQPYAIMLAATGKQGAATITAISEACVNLGSSIYLASKLGAIGVAFGTLLGSFVSLSLHFAISMRLTQNTLSISRTRLFSTGILRPSLIAIPSLALFPLWWNSHGLALGSWSTVLWVGSTLLLGWFGSLDPDERKQLILVFGNRLWVRGNPVA
jgi:O-antigen/teichoic acid export membrane protein